MTERGTGFRLELLGTFSLHAPDGERIHVASRKGMALIAMVAMSGRGERTRSWLQDRLWGTRERTQAQQSLRRELATLRALLDWHDVPLLSTDRERVRIDLRRLSIDATDVDPGRSDTFLEGFELTGEPVFAAWLDETRQAIRASGQPTMPPPPEANEHRDRPSIVVQRVVNLSGDPALDRTAELIGREMLDRLARLRWIAAIAGKDAASGATGIDQRYRLNIELRQRAGETVWTSALVDSADGRTLWSDRAPIDAATSVAAIERNALYWVGAIDAQVETAEQERVLNKSLEDLDLDEMIWRARWHLNRMTREDAAIAEDLTARVLAARPHSPDALIQAAFCTAWGAWVSRKSTEQIREMGKLALRAAAADPFDPRGHLLVGMAETWLKQSARAELALGEAIRLNPSFCQAHMQLGSALYLSGKPEAALTPMETALKLNPHDSLIFCVLAELGMVHWMLGHHARAIDFADRALIRKPAYWYAHLIKINALVGMGNTAAVARARAELSAARPGFDPNWIDWLPFIETRWLDRLKDGLDFPTP